MNVFQVAGLGLVCLFLVLILQEQKSHFGIFVVIAFGVIVFGSIFTQVRDILEAFRALSTQANVNQMYLVTMFKVIGIAYIGEFSAELCRDSGSSSLASKIELATKIMILSLAVPIILAILETILDLMP